MESEVTEKWEKVYEDLNAPLTREQMQYTEGLDNSKHYEEMWDIERVDASRHYRESNILMRELQRLIALPEEESYFELVTLKFLDTNGETRLTIREFEFRYGEGGEPIDIFLFQILKAAEQAISFMIETYCNFTPKLPVV